MGGREGRRMRGREEVDIINRIKQDSVSASLSSLSVLLSLDLLSLCPLHLLQSCDNIQIPPHQKDPLMDNKRQQQIAFISNELSIVFLSNVYSISF